MPAGLARSACLVSYSPASFSLQTQLTFVARNKTSFRKTPEICPVCGEEVPRGAVACRECGADHNSGWRDDAADYDGIDLPDPDFNYDEFIDQEFGSGPKPRGLGRGWWIAAVLLLLVFLALLFRFPIW